MKRCVIHIGMSQTSSTTIQATFRGRLNNSKWKFPVFASGVSHNRALSVILLDDYCPPTAWHKKIGTDQNTLQNLKKELTEKLLIEMDTDSENFLISAEWLNLEYMGLSQIRYLRDLIVRYADNILVVGYIRSPKSYMESSFQQQVKTKKAQFDLHSLYPRYRQRLEKFDEVFGKENVLFWKFDPSNLLNSCVIQDFCSRLNINFPLYSIKKFNENLSREATMLLYAYRKYRSGPIAGKKKSFENNLLINRLSTLNGNRLRFAWNSVRPVLDSNTADIEWMESRMGVSLKETLEDETDAIQCENDLFSYKTKELLWLAEQLGLDSSKSLPSHMLPEQVADLIDNLRNKLAENSENEGKIGTNKKRKDRTSNTGSSKQTRSSNIIEEIQNKEMVTSVKTNDTNMLSIDAIKEIYNKFWKPSYKSITPREAYFIQEGIIKCKPKRFLEIGTASGISTGLIATFLGLNSGNEVVTLDLRKTLWTDHTKETGFLAEEICKKDVIITHITEKNSAYLPEKYLDNKFDMAFIDASHQHPWPTLDMLAVLPLMKEGTFIYHHDLALFYNRNQTNARGIGPKYLFDQMPQSIRFVAPFGGKNIYYIITPGNYESLSGALIDALYLPWTLNNKIPEPNFMNYIDIAKKYWDNNVVEALEITFKRYNPAIA